MVSSRIFIDSLFFLLVLNGKYLLKRNAEKESRMLSRNKCPSEGINELAENL